MLTKKDFKELAETIANIFWELDLTETEKETILRRIEDFCIKQNPRFDPIRFEKAIKEFSQ